MIERPILMSAPMVRAIIEDRKHRTRRIIKPQPETVVAVPLSVYVPIREGQVRRLKSPYGEAGDRLWVRENFRFGRGYDGVKPSEVNGPARIHFEADGPAPEWAGRLHPAIHLPRRWSRLVLEVRFVDAERLLHISERDARWEGLEEKDQDFMPSYRGTPDLPWREEFPRDAFFDLWDSIHGKDAHTQNPWVWVVGFRRISLRGLQIDRKVVG